jgi:osmotically-inducible protein OsmY
MGFTPEQITGIDHRGKGPRGYRRSDKRILNDHLYLDPYIDASDIKVRVDNHEVILTGTVEDRNAKSRAEDIADSIPGVENVENRIRITKVHVADPRKPMYGELI